VESPICPACSSPVLPGQAFCATCGTALPGAPALPGTPALPDPPEAAAAEVDPSATLGTPDDPRLAALGLASTAPPEHRPPAALPAAPPAASQDPAPSPEASPWTLQPSSAGSGARPAGSSVGVLVGATAVSSVNNGRPTMDAVPAPPAEDLSGSWPSAPPEPPRSLPTPFETTPPPVTPPATVVPWTAPTGQVTYVAPTQPSAMAVAEHQSTSDVPARKESMQELVAFGLVAGGAATGIASLFLPWANALGIGVGATGSPPPNQWGWGMPAAIPLFLLSVLVLGAASGSDRAQERLPNLTLIITRITDLILPMILGGVYLGVFLLYVTLPWGFGGGVFGVLLGAALLMVGAVVTLFFPPEAIRDADRGNGAPI